jgi:hypothetical protein
VDDKVSCSAHVEFFKTNTGKADGNFSDLTVNGFFLADKILEKQAYLPNV